MTSSISSSTSSSSTSSSSRKEGESLETQNQRLTEQVQLYLKKLEESVQENGCLQRTITAKDATITSLNESLVYLHNMNTYERKIRVAAELKAKETLAIVQNIESQLSMAKLRVDALTAKVDNQRTKYKQLKAQYLKAINESSASKSSKDTSKSSSSTDNSKRKHPVLRPGVRHLPSPPSPSWGPSADFLARYTNKDGRPI